MVYFPWLSKRDPVVDGCEDEGYDGDDNGPDNGVAHDGRCVGRFAGAKTERDEPADEGLEDAVLEELEEEIDGEGGVPWLIEGTGWWHGGMVCRERRWEYAAVDREEAWTEEQSRKEMEVRVRGISHEVLLA